MLCGLFANASRLPAQTVGGQTLAQIHVSFDAHHNDFDYLRGDWEFTSVHRDYGTFHGYWELVSIEAGTGLQNLGTGRMVGTEMLIEQRFGVLSPAPSLWRIRYSDIQPDRVSWSADRSTDEGTTWVGDYLHRDPADRAAALYGCSDVGDKAAW